MINEYEALIISLTTTIESNLTTLLNKLITLLDEPPMVKPFFLLERMALTNNISIKVGNFDITYSANKTDLIINLTSSNRLPILDLIKSYTIIASNIDELEEIYNDLRCKLDELSRLFIQKQYWLDIKTIVTK